MYDHAYETMKNVLTKIVKLLTKMCSWQPSWKQYYLQWSYPSEYKRYEFITISIEGSRVVSKAHPISYFTLLPVLLSCGRLGSTFPPSTPNLSVLTVLFIFI